MLKNKCYVFAENAEVPTHMHFGQYILDKLMEHRDTVALKDADTGESLTYGELAQNTVDTALSLTRMGVRKGDVVSICSEKRFEQLTTILGIFCAGATFSPSDIIYVTGSNLHQIKITKPKIMFCSPTAFDLHKESFDTAGCIDQYIVYGDEDKHGGISFKNFLTEHADVKDFLSVPVEGWKDYVSILFSSGTTGPPKCIPLTHLGLINSTMSFVNDSLKEERSLSTREWYNAYGLGFALGALRAGATLVYSARNGHEDCLAAIEKYKIKFLQLITASVVELIKSSVLDDYDVSSVEGIMCASMPLPAEQVRAVKDRFPNLRDVYQLYGLTEAGSVCNEHLAPNGPRDGSVGTPGYGFTMKVVGLETRRLVGPNERGEICFKSPSVTPGYLSVSNDDFFDEEGFYKSGDVGYYDEDRYFYIVDRIKELIKYKDTGIAPAELESILMQHPSVREVGVVGQPNVDCGEAPTAFVALLPGSEATEEELVAFLEARVTFRMKLAGGVRFVERLPRLSGNKLDRKALRIML
ncbi:Luciferin 4-monooxygenase [Operophtera brumata]|uniref:Luciferin 4-monooxygenase n=1 Tax=Operophtera brumata TaxID=104452 RepID=A0A0L7L765_OPEBR|nr:Luciferin 4-monooxygenase [Operophtera brumata]